VFGIGRLRSWSVNIPLFNKAKEFRKVGQIGMIFLKVVTFLALWVALGCVLWVGLRYIGKRHKNVIRAILGEL